MPGLGSRYSKLLDQSPVKVLKKSTVWDIYHIPVFFCPRYGGPFINIQVKKEVDCQQVLAIFHFYSLLLELVPIKRLGRVSDLWKIIVHQVRTDMAPTSIAGVTPYQRINLLKRGNRLPWSHAANRFWFGLWALGNEKRETPERNGFPCPLLQMGQKLTGDLSCGKRNSLNQ